MNYIRKRDLIRIFLRSFYIQGAWNFERMLGLGLCFSLIPVARRLFDSDEDIKDFLVRHLDYFNSHPYMASFALGALARLEEQALFKKWDDKGSISIFKERLCGPLGAIGDTIFWKLLKPLSAAIGLIITIMAGWIGIVVALVLYNFFHFYIRAAGIYLGYKKGFDIIRDLSISGTKKYAHLLHAMLSLVAGSMLIVIFFWIQSWAIDIYGSLAFILLLTISLFLISQRKLSVEMNIIIILSISIIIGLMV